jgi:hypothetical protein
MSSENLYEGREQTKVKHFILRKYLERVCAVRSSARLAGTRTGPTEHNVLISRPPFLPISWNLR